MRYLVAVFLACLFLFPAPAGAKAAVVAHIDLSQQTMRVYVNGVRRYTWRVSTGRGRYRTPTGSWRPTFLKRRHYSSKYNNAPMPYSVFLLPRLCGARHQLCQEAWGVRHLTAASGCTRPTRRSCSGWSSAMGGRVRGS